MQGSNWGPRRERLTAPNIPTILPPGTKNPLLRAILLRARFEELLYLLANLPREGADVIRFDPKLSRGSSVSYNSRGFRDDHAQNPKRARDSLFKERRSVVSAIDSIYPVFRVPASVRIAFTKCTRKVFIGNPSLVGFILGPRGESLKALEKKYQVRISIRGKGLSTARHAPAEPDEDLHALIEGTSERQLDECVKEIESLLIPLPDSENERKKNQLKWLSVLNGVVSSEAAFKDDFTQAAERPPWFDENVETLEATELEDAMMNLKRQIESKEKGTTDEAERFDRFMVDLTDVDVSVLMGEPRVPGLDH
jgi:splicing factor 1